MNIIHFKNYANVSEHLKKDVPTFYLSSRTSTVIPYEKLEEYFPDTFIGDLSGIPVKMELEGELLHIEGAVTWQEAKAFCASKGREIMTSPTEELAMIGAGVSTSATGERCFGYGTVRDQIDRLIYLDYQGNEQLLSSTRALKDHPFFEGQMDLLKDYQQSYMPFLKFKNAPFPRLLVETDLMTGTEGQLGIVKEVWLKTAPLKKIRYFFMNLPKWEEDDEPHMEVFEKVQFFRHRIISCELIDSNSLSYLPQEKRVGNGSDLIFLEIDEEGLEEVVDAFFTPLNTIPIENIFEVGASACREFRMNVPRYIFEVNAKEGVNKKGTDAQVTADHMKDLFDFYRGWTKRGIDFNLFGHFGDAHLHFNFMPPKSLEDDAQKILEELYQKVLEWNGSPFAEHGVGLFKQKFIAPFYGETQYKMFQFLKSKMDPQNNFFPQGFLNLKEGP